MMGGVDLLEPRFPGIDAGAPHYESYYLKARHPDRAQAFWLRHTVHHPPDKAPTASLWLTLFDDALPAPVATKATVPGGQLGVPEGGFIRIGGAELHPGRARGDVPSATTAASWDLTFDSGEEQLAHLPAGWMYGAPLPRTKSLTPYPAARFGGRLAIGEHELDLAGWIGMVGHNWGAEHAERWIWMHCGQFEGHGEDTWIDLVLGRVKVGPVVTPWIGNGALSLAGVRHRLGGPNRVRQTIVEESPARARFVMAGDDARVEALLEAPREQVVAWRYADPEGPEHHTSHCSITDLRLELRRAGGETVELRAPAAASYELGMRETDHGLDLQPYADGQL